MVSVLVCLAVVLVAYASELGSLVQPGQGAVRQMPESAVLVLLGIALLLMAHRVRRQRTFPQPVAANQQSARVALARRLSAAQAAGK